MELWGSFITICIVLIASVLYKRWISSLQGFPGPFIAHITRLWYTWVMWRGKQHVILPRLHEKYGPYVRVAPNEIHTTDPKLFKTIYGPGSKFCKTDFFAVFQGARKFDLVSERDRKIHASHKRLIARAYSLHMVKTAEGSIDTTISTLIHKLNTRAGTPFDIGRWIQYWSFDTIGMVTFSKDFGFMRNEGDPQQTLLQIRHAMDSAAWLGQIPWFYAFFQKYVRPITGDVFALANRHQSIRAFAIEQVHERQSLTELARPDIMHSLLQIHKVSPAFNTDALQSMATTNIFGGAETTTSSLRAALYYILKNPKCKDKLMQEISDYCGQGTEGRENVISFEQARQMKYLRAVILEAMRLFPANGIPSGRVVPAPGLEVNGHLIPPGTEITIFSWSFHQRADIFGPNANVFEPDRWLDARMSESLEAFFFSFGSGARICLGRNIAWIEMTKCLATLFAHFDIQLVNPDMDWLIDGSFIKGQTGIEIILYPKKRS